jgi:hypothetical protein
MAQGEEGKLLNELQALGSTSSNFVKKGEFFTKQGGHIS